MGLGPVRHPEVLNKISTPNAVEITLKIPADLAYLEGHFPDAPIVPGVVQLHWAVEFAKEVFHISGIISEGKQIKFSNLLRPEEEICLKLEHFPAKSLIAYIYKTDEKYFSSGKFIYHDPSGLKDDV